MKKIICFIMVVIPVIVTAQQMNVISYNIRLNTPIDGENAWPNRAEMVTGLLGFHEADLFGLQEAMTDQIADIENALPEYEWIGVGREDGDTLGEYSPVFFRSSMFDLLDSGTFWLSETPETPGRGWDAAYPRVVTWGHFKLKENDKAFLFFNTHFDHRGDTARTQSAILIQQKIEEMNTGNLPVILTGDFNLAPDTEPIGRLKETFRDSREASKEPPYGPVGTFSNFKLDADLSSYRIDYIFVRGAIDVLKYGALAEINDNRFPSDHLPVFAKIELQ